MADTLHNLMIVGLGNPGEQYATTRHNIGFMALDHFAKSHALGHFIDKKSSNALVLESKLFDAKIFFVKPTTFMNRSGISAQYLSSYYKIPLDSILVIHDDLDIHIGEIRIKVGGSSGGHNGIKSIDEHIGKEYMRVRLGIKYQNEKFDAINFVLGRFRDEDLIHLENVFKVSDEIISSFIQRKDLSFMQNHFTIKLKRNPNDAV